MAIPFCIRSVPYANDRMAKKAIIGIGSLGSKKCVFISNSTFSLHRRCDLTLCRHNALRNLPVSKFGRRHLGRSVSSPSAVSVRLAPLPKDGIAGINYHNLVVPTGL